MKKLLILSVFISGCFVTPCNAQSLSYYSGPSDPYQDMDAFHSITNKNVDVSLETGCTTYHGNFEGSLGGAAYSLTTSGGSIFNEGISSVWNYLLYDSYQITINNVSGTLMFVVWGAYGGWGTASAVVY